MKAVYCLLLFFTLLYSSCQKEISVPLPKYQQKLAINSFFTKDSIYLYLTQSQMIYDKLIHANISDASIILKLADEFLYNIDYSDKGFYTSSVRLSENKSYTIEITTKGYNMVCSNDYLPELVKIDSLVYHPKIGIDEDGNEYSELYLIFSDPPESKNFYEICLNVLYYSKSIYHQGLWSDDIVVTNEGDFDFYYRNILFSDILINGLTYKLRFNIWHDDNDIAYFLHFRSISENYYKYKKSLMRHLANQEGDVWSGTGNPVDLYSNIQGGYGIFAGYQEDVDTIYINK